MIQPEVPYDRFADEYCTFREWMCDAEKMEDSNAMIRAYRGLLNLASRVEENKDEVETLMVVLTKEFSFRMGFIDLG